MLQILILGSAAGGGAPQWNCGCEGCRAARTESALDNGQVGAAVSADGENWLLLNASPDIRAQINATPALHPRGLRDSPVSAVMLANGEIDAVAGLLSLREGAPFTLYAHEAVLGILKANSIFDALRPDLVARRAVALNAPFRVEGKHGADLGLTVTAFAAPGKQALYLEAARGEEEGDTIGLEISDGRSRFFYLPAVAAMTPDLRARLKGADLVFFDGTLWRDDEMIRAGLSQKTGRRMGHMSMSGPDGTIAAFEDLGVARKVFVHINNSNPVLRATPERAEAEAAGWTIARPGQEFRL